jgi:DNA-binding response OmpR family regulator
MTDELTTPPRVLIVDDDQMARETLEAILYREGHTLLFASSGIEALERFQEFAPDVILLDVMMPNMNGFEVCQHLKGSLDYRHIPIILVTALDDAGDLVRGLNAGADEFVSKPVNGPELRARVRSMLRIKRQYDELQHALYLRDLLASIIAHDLRNPLAAVVLYLQLLKKKSQALLPADQGRYLEMVLVEAQQMSNFLEDMLMLAKLEQGKLVPARAALDINKALQDTQKKFAGNAQVQHVCIDLQQVGTPPTEIMVDPGLFQRMLDHLVAHALKFSPANGRVTLRLEYPRHTSQIADTPQLRITLCDEGADLAPQERIDMFSKYAVIEMKQHGKAQFGLGLPFCKMVVDAHNGRIFANPNVPKGTMITVEL